MDGDADIAKVAALIGDPARAAILDALLDGANHRAGELAERAGIAPSTASAHLARLLDGGLVECERLGRERRFRLASPAVAAALEALAQLAPPTRVQSLRASARGDAIRRARTCYDHLAGRVGVAVTDALVAGGALVPVDAAFALTTRGERKLTRLGVDVAEARSRRRAFALACLDWSERRPHLAGALGAALADAVIDAGWLKRRPHDRGLIVTHAGEEALRRELKVAL